VLCSKFQFKTLQFARNVMGICKSEDTEEKDTELCALSSVT